MRKNILITGKVKSGKTTLVEEIVKEISQKTGFLTKEIAEENVRTGFAIKTSHGFSAVIAQLEVPTPNIVGRFFVNIPAIDAVLPQVWTFDASDTLYIDEIGQMQLLSHEFANLVARYFDSSNTCIATISQIHVHEFTETLRKRNDVILLELSPENREEQKKLVQSLLRKIEKARNYISEPERFVQTHRNVTLRSEHGIRTLALEEGEWKCDCDFFTTHHICSHSIATEEYLRTESPTL